MRTQTREMVDLAPNVGGTFFLPHQIYDTPEQVRRAYPQIDPFFAAKRKYDTRGLLTSTFYQRFALPT